MATTDPGGESRARVQQESVEGRLETPTCPSAGGVNGDTGKRFVGMGEKVTLSDRSTVCLPLVVQRLGIELW